MNEEDAVEYVRVDAANPAQRDAPTDAPLSGKWHHGNGILCCGSLRIAAIDIDTQPAEAVQAEILDWMCARLNAPAQDAERERQQGGGDAELLDFLADPDQNIAQVVLPIECVTQNMDSMRMAIRAAMGIWRAQRAEGETQK
ncbi:hypothetical protein BAU08_05645 [Bordetella bronchialis]|uniref:Uncharacterized protein n=2 Tax=Bordetella bronchialis TaxID=463025 RepID=A0A193FU75_9BORD|nr:hypothetical protein BAU08_05645 [Bordetella bronchialis]